MAAMPTGKGRGTSWSALQEARASGLLTQGADRPSCAHAVSLEAAGVGGGSGGGHGAGRPGPAAGDGAVLALLVQAAHRRTPQGCRKHPLCSGRESVASNTAHCHVALLARLLRRPAKLATRGVRRLPRRSLKRPEAQAVVKGEERGRRAIVARRLSIFCITALHKGRRLQKLPLPFLWRPRNRLWACDRRPGTQKQDGSEKSQRNGSACPNAGAIARALQQVRPICGSPAGAALPSSPPSAPGPDHA